MPADIGDQPAEQEQQPQLRFAQWLPGAACAGKVGSGVRCVMPGEYPAGYPGSRSGIAAAPRYPVDKPRERLHFRHRFPE